MTPEHWQAVLARITPQGPVDLDVDLAVKLRGKGLTAWPAGVQPPSPKLWAREEAAVSYLGIRVRTELGDGTVPAALRLAAAALERGINPIVLAVGGAPSGFERFGFRVEQFAGGTADDQQRWEDEMTAFWSLALIIDADDVAALR
ncbi:MAG: hypothetical protein WBA90_17220 [Albidovulum sp.]